jgi:hypothetical protein
MRDLDGRDPDIQVDVPVGVQDQVSVGVQDQARCPGSGSSRIRLMEIRFMDIQKCEIWHPDGRAIGYPGFLQDSGTSGRRGFQVEDFTTGYPGLRAFRASRTPSRNAMRVEDSPPPSREPLAPTRGPGR